MAASESPAPVLKPAVNLCSAPLHSHLQHAMAQTSPAALAATDHLPRAGKGCCPGAGPPAAVLCSSAAQGSMLHRPHRQPRLPSDQAKASGKLLSVPCPGCATRAEPCCAADILKDVLQPVDQVWMSERFRIAAVARYRRLSVACDDQMPFGAADAAAAAPVAVTPAGCTTSSCSRGVDCRLNRGCGDGACSCRWQRLVRRNTPLRPAAREAQQQRQEGVAAQPPAAEASARALQQLAAPGSAPPLPAWGGQHWRQRHGREQARGAAKRAGAAAAQALSPPDAEVAYARLGALCQAIKNELQNDLNIHDASVLPAYVNLPQVTAAEYSQVRRHRGGRTCRPPGAARGRLCMRAWLWGWVSASGVLPGRSCGLRPALAVAHLLPGWGSGRRTGRSSWAGWWPRWRSSRRRSPASQRWTCWSRWASSRSTWPGTTCCPCTASRAAWTPCSCSWPPPMLLVRPVLADGSLSRPCRRWVQVCWPGALTAACCAQVFGPYVANWINGSQEALCARGKQLAQSQPTASKLAPGGAQRPMLLPWGDPAAAPRARAACFSAICWRAARARRGMRPACSVARPCRRCAGQPAGVGDAAAPWTQRFFRYERVIQYWPVFGPLLEGAVCAVLRETTHGVCQQCSPAPGQPPLRAPGGPAGVAPPTRAG